jgi:phospholipid/cholesterol/gamma-HCH transport system substrate-binding protein
MRALGQRFEVRPGMHRPRPMLGGVIVLVIFGALLYYGYSSGNLPFLSQGGYDVRAVFSSAANVRPGKTPVRVRGIDVGAVSDVRRTANGDGVVVTMHITNPGVHLTGNASAQVYWRTLLGFEYYVQLDPGTSPKRLRDQVIPISRTGVQVEVDQVLQALTPPSRKGIQTTFDQFATAFGPGNQAGASIDALAPAMENAAPGIQALRGTESGDLTNTVGKASRLASSLSQTDAALGDLMVQTDRTLGATSSQQASIDAALQQGPQTLADTRTTMSRLDGTLELLDPIVEALRPGARELAPASVSLDPALRQLIPLLDEARPTLVSLRPALSRLAAAGTTGAPLLRSLTPTFAELNSAIIPALGARDPSTHLRLYEAIGPTAATVASSASLYDANGHTQRFEAVNGGAKSPSFLPCGLDLSAYKLSCSDLQTVFGELLGAAPSSLTHGTPALAGRSSR